MLVFSVASLPQVAVHGQTIDTIAGSGAGQCAGDGGLATAATFSSPFGVTVDAAGNVFIADLGCSAVRRVDAVTKVVTRFAGTYNTFAYAGDGGAAASASLNAPTGVAVDANGNVFIADQLNDCIRRVDGTSQIITTYAGQCGVFCGTALDNVPATSSFLCRPFAVAVDAAGNLFIADTVHMRIRRVDAASPHNITTFAGTGTAGYNGDNIAATTAQLSQPTAVAVDDAGNVFIADTDNFRVRRVDASSSFITTIAGTGTNGFNGNNIPATSAEISYPYGVAADSSGSVFFSDRDSHCVRQVGCDGLIRAAAGTCTSAGFSGDGGPATSAQLSYPEHLGRDAVGNVLICDSSNGRVRQFHPVPCVAQTSSQFCISGTSSGAPYSWWVDVLSDNANQSFEPFELSAPAVPIGAPATILASELAQRITNHPKSVLLGISASATGACFDVAMPKVCAGGLNPGAPCVVNADCPGGGICSPEVFSLLVGPGSAQPNCTVTATGCTYNPLITLGCTTNGQCDDGNVCTDDTCGGTSGCLHANNANVCDDGNAETSGDSCQSGVCTGSSCTSTNDPKTKGWYGSLCNHAHSGDVIGDADAACVGALTTTFAGFSTAGQICDVFERNHSGNDTCSKAEDHLMALAINICRERVCQANGIDSSCGNASSVGESLSEADTLLSNPSRTNAQCDQAECLAKEINNGHALEFDTLSVTREGGSVRLNWTAPILDDGTGTPTSYTVWRRPVGSAAPFVQLGTSSEVTFLDASAETGNWQYNVTSVN